MPRELCYVFKRQLLWLIGKPIASTGRTAEALAAEVESWIENEMRRISPHPYTGEPATQRAGLLRQ